MAAASRIALVVGGALGAALIGTSLSMAQSVVTDTADASAAAAPEAPQQQIDFTDPQAAIESPTTSLRFSEPQPRFSQPDLTPAGADQRPQRFELELAAQGGAGVPDVAIAQRATFGVDDNGDIDRRGRGSELRVGRGLVEQRQSSPERGSVYMFVASDDEALTWSPGARTSGADSFNIEDRVEVGDLSAGVTFERHGVQASIAYVEREISTTVGRQSYSRDERFAGVTLTMRR